MIPKIIYDLKSRYTVLTSEYGDFAQPADFALFEQENNVIIPSDLKDYFIFFNGTNGEYTDDFFRFYSLRDFKDVEAELSSWSGSPDYSKITNTLNDAKEFYVFADFTFNMFSYGIKLGPKLNTSNEVIVIAGSQFRKIANSFTEFLELYLSDSYLVQF